LLAAACNKKSDDAGNATAELVSTAPAAPAVAVVPGAVTVAGAPGAVTGTHGGAGVAPAQKTVVAGGPAAGVQLQVGGKKIEVSGANGQVDIGGVTGLAAKATAAPAVPAPAAPKSGPCAQLAAKCPKCTPPHFQQACNFALTAGAADPVACQNALNDHDIQANCK
jgi:hypothetical protein